MKVESATYIDIFVKRVSLFPKTNIKGDATCTLGEFLAMGKQYAADIMRAREIKRQGDKERYKEIKKGLPCIIPQGVCPTAKDEGPWKSFTDILCLDIDGDESLDLDALKAFFSQLKFVAYCGLSLGGQGLFVLIPIATHERHAECWAALEQLLAKVNITVDPATKNLARKRVISYDETAYYNHNALVFDAAAPKPKKAPRLEPIITAPAGEGETLDDRQRMGAAVEDIVRRRIDITDGYDEWIKVAASIAHTQGESGRNWFHAISRISSKYNEREADNKYSSMMNGGYSGTNSGYGSFFALCKRYGVKVPPSIKRGSKPAQAKKVQRPRTKSEQKQVQHLQRTPSELRRTESEPREKAEIRPAALEELKQRAELITAHHFMLEEIEERNPGFKDFMQEMGARYCGGGGVGWEWQMSDEQQNYLLKRNIQI